MRMPVPRATFASCIGGMLLVALAACSPGTDGQGPASASEPAAPASVARPAAAPAPAGSVAPAATARSGAGTAMKSLGEEDAILRVAAMIRKHHLTELADACLLYATDQADADSIDIDVREKHDAACGGDPDTAPRLFSFKLDRATGRLTTDALDPADPAFKPID
jgi:hypothetical protein